MQYLITQEELDKLNRASVSVEKITKDLRSQLRCELVALMQKRLNQASERLHGPWAGPETIAVYTSIRSALEDFERGPGNVSSTSPASA